MTITLSGIPGAQGIAEGEAFVIEHETVQMPRMLVTHGLQIPEEVARLRWALRSARQELAEIRQRLSGQLGEDALSILDAHVAILADESLLDEAVALIRDKGLTAEWGLARSLQTLRKQFAESSDENFRLRVADVDAVEQRALRRLRDKTQIGVPDVPRGCVVVARDLSAADAAQIARAGIRGLVTEVGGRTSHTAVVARAAGIPAVVGVANLAEVVSTGDALLVDGGRGEVVVRPSVEDRAEFALREKHYLAAEKSALTRSLLPTTTAEGFPISIRANIQSVSCVDLALGKGARGVGLFRTEFLFLNRMSLPDEDEQYAAYREVVERVAPEPVTIRTLDLGGDKMPAVLAAGNGVNRALGLRGIRFTLKHRNLFKIQLRAILRASAHGHVRIVLPMISGLREVAQSMAVIEEVRSELAAEHLAMGAEVPVGVMIEVPSAVVMAGVLADSVSFLSIGTNDLIQYSLAIDRANEQVAYLYEPLHPAILRMIKSVVRAADSAGIPVTLCGEMAGDPKCVPVLLGLGLRVLSMNALAIPKAKEAIRATSLEHARQLARDLLALGSSEEVNARLAESDWYARLWLTDSEGHRESLPGVVKGAGVYH